MTKLHDVAYYQDGHVQVAFCKVCSAEGDKLLEDCPQKISQNCVDPSEIQEDFWNYT